MRRRVPLDRLGADPCAAHGLSADEARERRLRHGPNAIVESARRPWRDLARDTARDPMLWFLLGTGTLYAALGNRLEAVTVLVALAPLLGMDAFLNHRASASTEALRRRLAAQATVRRDGRPTLVAVTEVVPGDVALVGPGETFPADGLLVGGEDLQVDESVLTGEAYAVRKRRLDGSPGASVVPLLESLHWGFAGTRLLTGRATLRVAFTGGETLYGEIVRSATAGGAGRTPLQAAIANLVAVLVVVATAICLILAFVRLRQGYDVADALLSAVTLAVAALPEEFPVVLAVFLGAGAYRLAKRRALVRRAASVESIGRITCICTDKTGTITEGRPRLAHLEPVPGTAPDDLLGLAAAAARPDGGDPLDEAVWRALGARGLPTDAARLATFAFTEARRRETAVVRDPARGALAVTKGATEVVLGLVAATASERADWEARAVALAAEGRKVIACAWRPLDEAGWPGGEPDHGYRLAGLLAFEDPVRDGVAEAVRACGAAGIRPIMVTGDHPATAAAVARAIGLGGAAPLVVSGDVLEARIAAGESLRGVHVVARALPAQKTLLVRALQSAGEVVAVTGDGVNDVPALNAADVGIAMGERADRSAHDAASIVLLDDNFRTIVRAVAEGRQLFRNLRLSFTYLLVVHVPLVMSAALIPLAGYPLLYLPVHIVWLELVIHPTALLVFQDLPPGRLAPVRRHGPARFFSGLEWALVAGVGTLLTVHVVAAYVHGLGATAAVGHARSLALAALTLASAMLTAALTGLRTATARGIAAATAALSVLLIQTPALAAILHLEPLHLSDWVAAALGSALCVSLLPLGRALGRLTGGGRRGRGAPS